MTDETVGRLHTTPHHTPMHSPGSSVRHIIIVTESQFQHFCQNRLNMKIYFIVDLMLFIRYFIDVGILLVELIIF